MSEDFPSYEELEIHLLNVEHERDQLRADLTEISNIVHHGGLIGFTDECSAQNEIRRITFPYWDMSAAEKLQRGGR